jgi:hypothetical protein
VHVHGERNAAEAHERDTKLFLSQMSPLANTSFPPVADHPILVWICR